MKYLIFVILLLPAELFSQKIIAEKIPKGWEGENAIIETIINKDTVVIKCESRNNYWLFTSNDFEIDSDTAVYISKDIAWFVSGRLSKSKWDSEIKTGAFSKSCKAIQQWQLAVIKEKYPDYYNKWLKK